MLLCGFTGLATFRGQNYITLPVDSTELSDNSLVESGLSDAHTDNSAYSKPCEDVLSDSSLVEPSLSDRHTDNSAYSKPCEDVLSVKSLVESGLSDAHTDNSAYMRPVKTFCRIARLSSQVCPTHTPTQYLSRSLHGRRSLVSSLHSSSSLFIPLHLSSSLVVLRHISPFFFFIFFFLKFRFRFVAYHSIVKRTKDMKDTKNTSN